VADEVIVVDSSDDGTGDVCREEGATVHYHPWPGDFSVQRNIALGTAGASGPGGGCRRVDR
jgi:glycosyltransferase involved in cell wall biosynthesis